MGQLLDSLNLNGKIEINMGFNSPLFGMTTGDSKKEETIKKIVTILGKEINFYKNTLYPLIRELSVSIKNAIDKADKENSYIPQIDVFEPPAFITMKLDTNLKPIRDFRTNLNVKLPDKIEWSDYIATLSDDIEYEQEMKDFITSVSVKDIDEAYDKYLKPAMISNIPYKRDANIQHLYIAIILLRMLDKSNAIGSGKLEDYNYFMELYYLNLLNYAIEETNRLINLGKNNYLIINTAKDNKDTKRILVNSRALNIFYQNGGVIESIYGASLLLNSVVKLEDIMANADKYIKDWESKVIVYEKIKTVRMKDIIVQIYNRELSPYITNEFTPLILNGILKSKTIMELLDINDTVSNIMLDYIYCNTNARLFTDRFKYYDNEVNNKKIAAKMATADLVVKYLMKDLQINKKDNSI